MKYLLAMILLLSALPTAQAAGCAMELEHEAAVHQHDLHDGAGAGDHESDCCDTHDEVTEHDCGQAAHCAPCLTIALGINTDPASGAPLAALHLEAIDGTAYSAPPLHPPFRPPIS